MSTGFAKLAGHSAGFSRSLARALLAYGRLAAFLLRKSACTTASWQSRAQSISHGFTRAKCQMSDLRCAHHWRHKVCQGAHAHLLCCMHWHLFCGMHNHCSWGKCSGMFAWNASDLFVRVPFAPEGGLTEDFLPATNWALRTLQIQLPSESSGTCAWLLVERSRYSACPKQPRQELVGF